MSRLILYLLLGFCVLAFTNNVRGDEDEDESGDEDGDEDGDGNGNGNGGGAIDVNLNINFGNDACVSADMKVEEQTKGVVRVADLSEGDLIYGITGPNRERAWCKVEAVFPSARGQNRVTHDGFTADHMVVGFDSVHAYGNKGEGRVGQVYTLATDCDASVNTDGQVFTPISMAFCPHVLSWSEYISLMVALRGVLHRTGYFWFDTSAYHNNKNAKVPHWLDELPNICNQTLLCKREGRCQGFEDLVNRFVHDHLNRKYAVIVEREFPNMGGDVNKQQAGTITEVVRSQNGGSHLVLFATLGSAMVGLMVIAVGILLYRTRLMKKKAEKELPFESDANHPKA